MKNVTEKTFIYLSSKIRSRPGLFNVFFSESNVVIKPFLCFSLIKKVSRNYIQTKLTYTTVSDTQVIIFVYFL